MQRHKHIKRIHGKSESVSEEVNRKSETKWVKDENEENNKQESDSDSSLDGYNSRGEVEYSNNDM